MTNILPSVGMSGSFAATTPFDIKINEQILYECTSVETIGALVASGQDPLNDIYILNGLTQENYDTALANNTNIVTLTASTGELVVIPGNYILGLPDANGIKYSNIMLGISLSALPDTFDLNPLMTEVADLVLARIGVASEVRAISFGTSNLLTQTQAAAVEAARQVKVSNNVSNLSRAEDLSNQVSALLLKVSVLEQYIKANLP